jgi:hypothetical protein
MIMLSAALRAVAPGKLEPFESECRAFQTAIVQSREESVRQAFQLAATARGLAAGLAGMTFKPGDTRRILDALLSDSLSARYTDYAGSEQAVMAIDTLRNDLVTSHVFAKADADAMQPDIEQLYKATHDPNLYRPVEFRALLQRVAVTIKGLER